MNYVDKGRFTESRLYAAAAADASYENIEAIDPKVASACKQDVVVTIGANNSRSMGACALAPEGCNYIVDKIGGISGACLKHCVGVRAANE